MTSAEPIRPFAGSRRPPRSKWARPFDADSRAAIEPSIPDDLTFPVRVRYGDGGKWVGLGIAVAAIAASFGNRMAYDQDFFLTRDRERALAFSSRGILVAGLAYLSLYAGYTTLTIHPAQPPATSQEPAP